MKPVSFINTFKAELKKTKNIYGFVISIAGPTIVTLGITLYLMTRLGSTPNDPSAWFKFGRVNFQFFFFLYPLYAALMAFLLINIEHKNRGFKHLFTLPVSKFKVYISKVLILWLWITSSLVYAIILIMVSGQLLGLLFPASGFAEPMPTAIFLAFIARLYIFLLGIVAIHYFLSLYFDNFIISVGSACFLVVAGMVAFNWEHSYLIPYAHPIFAQVQYLGKSTAIWDIRVGVNLAYALFFFIGGYFLIARKAVQ